ncbi:glutathione S-transferase C-terminal domain-containing protein [Streptomyces millisiae]|uniref:Glutathione S-transferase C-terminal domain-containing protein n=1 Tax=Streptomyces millisiae TaxID=3075542 RepID=A0ABU2LHT7_9ACTN|nr:glutathione S-transferase C-terminal domain-containing protein [Streptomyces sp. DSM 44918]MDT0317152.1 glutathione S-transferase C-terminal domain-containing protein [Streptomyces sp. DSM 44918]
MSTSRSTTSAPPVRPPEPAIRGRIGPDADHGFYPVAHRYHLYLSLSCPGCLRIAVTHALLGLDDRISRTLLPPVPDGPGAGYAALRAPYEATAHGYRGAARAPVLADRWTGRVVSNHTPDILRDLCLRFGGAGGPDLYPAAAEREIRELDLLCERDIGAAAQRAGQAGGDDASRAAALDTLLGALGALEERLATGPHLVGDALTAADVHLWVTLVQLDTVHRWHLDAEAVHRIAAHPRLWAFARRLLANPAFARQLRLDEIERRHHHDCRGLEAAGAAVQIIDWTATDDLLASPARQRRPR